jgi:hypothetical protein
MTPSRRLSEGSAGNYTNFSPYSLRPRRELKQAHKNKRKKLNRLNALCNCQLGKNILTLSLLNVCNTTGGTQVALWLRHCATNRKVAGSIPDGVIGIFD